MALGIFLLHRHSVTVPHVMSFLGKVNFCANDHSQLQQWCCVIESDMLNVYHSPGHLLSSFHFLVSALYQLR